jgi:hypothetical protein
LQTARRVALGTITAAAVLGSVIAFAGAEPSRLTRSARLSAAPAVPRRLSKPLPPPAPLSMRHVGPYWFIRGPLVVRPGDPANSGNDDVDVFLRTNRSLPMGRVYVTVNGVGAALTAGGTGVDIDASDATRWCYEVTIGNTETLTNRVNRYHLGQIVTVRLHIYHDGGTWGDSGTPIPTGAPGTAEARITLGRDSFPNSDPGNQRGPGSAFGFPLLGCPSP